MQAYDTLKLNKEFRRLYGRGKSAVSPVLVAYVLRNRLGYCRIGITTGKKIGCAVARNRARRVITAAWRQLLPDISGGYDIVFVARGKTPHVKSTDVLEKMYSMLESVGVQFKHS